MNEGGVRARYLWISALVVLADQATKALVDRWMGLHESRDIITGFSDSCELHPTMDGAGDLAFAAGYVGYGTYRWYVQGPPHVRVPPQPSGSVPHVWC